MSAPIIRCHQLRKSYGAHPVLDSVDFEISPGQLVGFLGPNGAGKTTTIRIMLGVLKQSSGKCEVFGKSCWSQGKEIRKDVGYLPGDVRMYASLTGRKLLNFMAKTRRLNCDDEIERLAESLELNIDRTIRKYSTGMRQKLGLIQALMHQPKLVVLDEPTSALDPLIRVTVFEELKKCVNEGRTVLFSSHSLSEVEELCDEVIILREGRVVEQTKVEVLRDRAIRRVSIKSTSINHIRESLPPEFNQLSQEGNLLTGTWTGPSKALIEWLHSMNFDDVIIDRPDLNDLFLAYYEKERARD